MNVGDIDENFNIKTKINEKNIKFKSVLSAPFDIHGADKEFFRMDIKAAEKINKNVERLAANTSGVRIRFKTNSRYIAVSVKYSDVCRMEHMSVSGTAGLDMYEYENNKYIFVTNFIPKINMNDEFEAIHYFKASKMRDITINLPLYSSVSQLFIGLDKNAFLEHGGKYKNEKPIIYYGSSITQGGCASRAGNSYPAIVSRRLNLDFINLGFSGNAKGEPAMAEYIASLDMLCFVMDYDFNAPDMQHLKNTHKIFFDTVRKKHKNLPIIIMSMPYNSWVENVAERKAIIKETYDAAVKSGDKNVYFIDGEKMFDVFGGDGGTVDGTHPNDLGFMCMAKEVGKYLKTLKEF